MSNAKVCVIIPVYRVDGSLLRECIDSVTSQTLRDIGIIIVDDGSPEDNVKIIDEYAGKDPRIKVIRQENKGASSARNAGLLACNADYVTFVDSDDYISKECLEAAIAEAEKGDLDVLIWGTYKLFPDHTEEYAPFTADVELLSDKQKEWLQLKTMAGDLPVYEYPCSKYGSGSCCSKLYRASFLRENDLKYPEKIVRSEDVNFNFRVFEKAGRIGYMNRFFYYYRQLAGSATYTYRDGGITIFTNALAELNRSITEFSKSDYYMQVFYMRCMFFILNGMDMDYCNPDNPKPYGVRMCELSSILREDPYRDAFTKLSYKNLAFTKKIPLFLMQHGWVRLLAMFYAVYKRAK